MFPIFLFYYYKNIRNKLINYEIFNAEILENVSVLVSWFILITLNDQPLLLKLKKKRKKDSF